MRIKRNTKRHSGDHLMISDRSGFRFPASEIVRQWDGLLVAKHEEEPRHPQEFVRGVVDDYAVRNPRPRPDVLATLSTGNTATVIVELVSRAGLELVTRDGDVLRSRGQVFTENDSIVSIDLGSIKWVSFATVNFSDLSNGKDQLNIYTSADNVTYEPLETPSDDILRSLTIGTDRQVPVGRRARYVALRFEPFGPQLQSNFTLAKFDIFGGSVNE